jgi:pseudo-rSAM protein
MVNTRIIIEPYVQVNLTEKAVLLYNTLSGENSISYNPEIISVFSVINKGVIELRNELSPKLLAFVNVLKKQYIADIEITSINKEFPISSYNNAFVINDIKKINNKEHIVNTKEYLNTVNIQLTNSCTERCELCDIFYKQAINCIKNGDNSSLSINEIKLIISQINTKTRINLFGGNLFKYNELNVISNFLKVNVYNNCVFYFNAATISRQNVNMLNSFSKFKIVIYIEMSELNTTIKYLPFFKNYNIEFKFLIDSEKTYNEIEKKLNIFSDYKVDFQPLYTGTNLGFFENNVYLNEEDIFSTNQSLKNIKTRNAINTNHFGKITIYSNGDIYFNSHKEKVGNIKTDTFSSLVEIELLKNKNWFEIRSKLEPCKDCIYNNLCPSVSDIELLLGKYNLCHYDLDRNIWK